MFTGRPGLMSLLKDGGKHFTGLEEATYRNIDACKKLSTITRTSLGPNSMNKLIVNHIDKSYVTSDAATMIEQLEVQHPAAKIIALASKMQEQEYGDATNFVVVFAGELLSHAELLLKQGIHSADVIKGYEIALDKCQLLLEESVCYKVKDIRSSIDLQKAISATISSKALGSEAQIAALIADAATSILPSNPAMLNLDNLRVAKLQGGSLNQSHVIQGMVITRGTTGTITSKTNCKVLVLGCGLEMTSTEAKGTVLIETSEQLLNFSKEEENKMEGLIKDIVDAKVEAIIVGGNISDIAQHFCNKYNILTLKCQSKFELQRICRTLGASLLVRLGVPTIDEMGHAESILVDEVSSKQITVIKAKDSKVATIVLRGATPNILDEVERTIDDGIHCIKNLAKDNRFVAGGGACEIEVGQKLQAYGATVTGLEQYAVVKFGEAFSCVARVIAENAGLYGTDVVTQLYTAHKAANKTVGVDVEGNSDYGIADMVEGRQLPVVDHFKTKECAIKLSADAAITVLKVDQIIMSRPAGGPKPPQQSGKWDED